MVAEPLNAAVVGLGLMGHAATVALERHPEWRLRAVAEPEPGLLDRALGVSPEAVGYDAAEVLLTPAKLAEHSVDAVFVMTPPPSHAALTIAALEAGAHVVCEKPMALDADECRRMMSAATSAQQEHGAITVVDHQLRYNRARGWLRAQLQAGAWGVVRHVQVVATFPTLLDRPWTWWSSFADGGGLLNEYGSHTVDLLHWWFGPSARAGGVLRTLRTDRATTEGEVRAVDSDEVASFRLEWSSGMFADVLLSAAPTTLTRSIHIFADDATVHLDGEDSVHVSGRDGTAVTHDLGELEPSLIGQAGETYTQPFYRLIGDLAQSVRQGALPAAATTFAEGLAIIERLDDVRRSDPRGSALSRENV